MVDTHAPRYTQVKSFFPSIVHALRSINCDLNWPVIVEQRYGRKMGETGRNVFLLPIQDSDPWFQCAERKVAELPEVRMNRGSRRVGVYQRARQKLEKEGQDELVICFPLSFFLSSYSATSA